jgi:hypothetical protein
MEGGDTVDRTAPAGLSARRFGLTVGGAFLALAGVAWWRTKPTIAAVVGLIGGVLIVAAAIAPALLVPVERVWMRMALAISRVTTPIVLGIVYFLVLTPMAILRRTFGKNPIVHTPVDSSYWVRRDTTRSDLERQF